MRRALLVAGLAVTGCAGGSDPKPADTSGSAVDGTAADGADGGDGGDGSSDGGSDGDGGSTEPDPPYGQELLEDGSFEELASGAWVVTGACEAVAATAALSPVEGAAFVAGATGNDVDDCVLEQVVDLSVYDAAAIDAGTVAAELEGWLANLGPAGPYDDQVLLRLTYEAADGAALSTLETLVAGTAEWSIRGATGLLPPGTRSLRVAVVSRFRNPPDNHSFADAVSLTLRAVTPTSPALTLAPLLQDHRADAMRLAWETDGNLALPGVSWGPTGSALGESTGVVRSIVVDDSHVVHVAEATGLEPATAYDYAVHNGDTRSEPATFHTAPLDSASAVRLGWLGDNQEGYERFATHLSHLSLRAPDLLVVPGDLVAVTERLSEWREFWWGPLVDTGRFGSETPVLAARGNHDLHHPYAYAYVQLPGNGLHYSFRYGPVFVAVVDSQILPNGLPAHVDPLTFLEDQLASEAARSATFRIVTFHQGPFTNSSGNGTNGNVGAREVWVPLFESAGVDMVITGHYHSYQRGTAPSGITYVTVGGGGSSLLADTYDFWDFLEEVELTWQYSVMDVDGSTLRFETYDLDDVLIDSFELTGGPL